MPRVSYFVFLEHYHHQSGESLPAASIHPLTYTALVGHSISMKVHINFAQSKLISPTMMSTNTVLMHSLLISIAYLVATMDSFVSGFPQGGPVEACDSLLPRHVHTKPGSASKSPYYLIASASHYDPHTTKKGIRVEIGGAPFKGFFVAAIDPHTGERVGEWAKVKGTETLPCAAITHIDNHPKRYASFLWIPPDHKSGDVSFVATVVESYAVYYTGIEAIVPGDTTTTLQSLQDPYYKSASSKISTSSPTTTKED